MSIGLDLRSFILGSTVAAELLGSRCHYNHLPQGSSYPHVWFRKAGDNEELTLDGVGGLHDAMFDLEVAGASEASAQAVADAIHPRLHGYKGALGGARCQGMFVSDQDDDYVPFTNQSDRGVHVIAHSVRLVYST